MVSSLSTMEKIKVLLSEHHTMLRVYQLEFVEMQSVCERHYGINKYLLLSLRKRFIKLKCLKNIFLSSATLLTTLAQVRCQVRIGGLIVMDSITNSKQLKRKFKECL